MLIGPLAKTLVLSVGVVTVPAFAAFTAYYPRTAANSSFFTSNATLVTASDIKSTTARHNTLSFSFLAGLPIKLGVSGTFAPTTNGDSETVSFSGDGWIKNTNSQYGVTADSSSCGVPYLAKAVGHGITIGSNIGYMTTSTNGGHCFSDTYNANGNTCLPRTNPPNMNYCDDGGSVAGAGWFTVTDGTSKLNILTSER